MQLTVSFGSVKSLGAEALGISMDFTLLEDFDWLADPCLSRDAGGRGGGESVLCEISLKTGLSVAPRGSGGGGPCSVLRSAGIEILDSAVRFFLFVKSN